VRLATSVLAALLLVLGISLYLGSGRASVTALIPAFFGVAFAACAAVATNATRRKHAMHAAAVLALLGAIGSARGIPDALELLGGGTVERPAAAWGQIAMMLLCIVFLVLAVRSFVAARRARGGGTRA